MGLGESSRMAPYLDFLKTREGEMTALVDTLTQESEDLLEQMNEFQVAGDAEGLQQVKEQLKKHPQETRRRILALLHDQEERGDAIMERIKAEAPAKRID